jgi:hypothetical protein
MREEVLMEARRAGADHVELLRRWVLGVLVLGLAGTMTELVLLEHYEQVLQFVPLVLIVAAVAAIAWQAMRNDAASLARWRSSSCSSRWRVSLSRAFPWLGGIQLDPFSMSAWELVRRSCGPRRPAARPR